MILSIDVGIRNLAMCLMDGERIVEWEVGGIPPLADEDIYVQMLNYLKERPWVLTCDTVLIEKQPDRNRKIKSVEDFLHAYFVIQEKNTIIYDARHKVPDISGPGKARYRERKQASIDRCLVFIKEKNPSLVQFFTNHKKKDDLADTVMQALSYKPVVQKETKKLVGRKPTSNQTETRYSKSNLLWLYKNNKHIGKGMALDKRFEKDIKLYYSSFDEFLAELSQ